MEDPIFVCEVAQSLVNQKSASKKGGRKSVKEKQKILTDVWSNLLEVSYMIKARLEGALSRYFCCFLATNIPKSFFLTFFNLLEPKTLPWNYGERHKSIFCKKSNPWHTFNRFCLNDG